MIAAISPGAWPLVDPVEARRGRLGGEALPARLAANSQPISGSPATAGVMSRWKSAKPIWPIIAPSPRRWTAQ